MNKPNVSIYCLPQPLNLRKGLFSYLAQIIRYSSSQCKFFIIIILTLTSKSFHTANFDTTKLNQRAANERIQTIPTIVIWFKSHEHERSSYEDDAVAENHLKTFSLSLLGFPKR